MKNFQPEKNGNFLLSSKRMPVTEEKKTEMTHKIPREVPFAVQAQLFLKFSRLLTSRSNHAKILGITYKS